MAYLSFSVLAEVIGQKLGLNTKIHTCAHTRLESKEMNEEER